MKTKFNITANHNYTIDFLRFFSMIIIVLGHSLERIMPTNIVDNVLFLCLFSFCRIGPSLFMMVSGYFLLNRTYDNASLKKFYLKNLLPLLICWEVWIIIYNLYFLVAEKTFVGWIKLIEQIFFLSPVELGHQWYMPCILILYALIPFIANGLHHIKFRYSLLIFVVLILLICIPPTFCNKPSIFTTYFNFVYLFYILLGYFAANLLRYFKWNKVKFINLFAGLFVYISMILWQVIYKSNNGTTPVILWYDSIFLILLSFSVFMTIMAFVKINKSNILYCFANSAFGVYLVHLPILIIISKNLKFNNYWVQCITFFAITYSLSYLICILISMIPYVGEFLIKSKQLFVKQRNNIHENKNN